MVTGAHRAGVGVGVVLLPSLPDPLPTHWNSQGVVDGVTAKPGGAFIGPVVMALMTLVFAALPRLSPAGYALERFERSYAVVQVALVAFIGVVSSAALLTAVGVPLSMPAVTSVALAALLGVLAWQAPRLERNFFVGIRTPWALLDDDNWKKTHLVFARLLGGAALVTLLSVVAPLPELAWLVAIGASVLAAIVWSWWLSRSTVA
ncbi:MAG: SdpI family protein [Myxococcota bacterium]